MPELGPELGFLVEGVFSQGAWCGGVVLVAGDLEKFGVALIYSRVLIELMLVVLSLLGAVANVAVEVMVNSDWTVKMLMGLLAG